MALQWVDIFVLAVIGLSAVLSLFRGLVREVLSLVGWVAAGGVAFKFAAPVAGVFSGVSAMPSIQLALAFIVLLIGTLLVFGVINFLVGKLIDSTGLSGTDRLLGMIFGVVRGVAIITVLVALAGLTPLPRDPWWQASRFLPVFAGFAKLAVGWLPPEFAKYLDYDRASPPPPPAAPASSTPPAALKRTQKVL